MFNEEGRQKKALEELFEDTLHPAWQELGKNGKTRELKEILSKAVASHRDALSEVIEKIANRIIPLRRQTWKWRLHPNEEFASSGFHVLTKKALEGPRPYLAGQRGLSLKRIEQLDNLRKTLQALNRLMIRQIGVAAVSLTGESVPDCCPELLGKIKHLKEQRINQTAHLIVQEALGLELTAHSASIKERRQTDIHGEYIRKPGREPVDFVVMEDLNRYKSSQGRTKRENSRLMKWCHRALIQKVKLLCEPFGTPVLEVPAGYSSRFCSRSGCPGFRAAEVSLRDFEKGYWQKKLLNRDHDVKELFELLRRANDGLERKVRTLIAPQPGGPIFIPLERGRPSMQADLNAAINIGLRAIASPKAHNIRHTIRAERKKDAFHVRLVSKLEKQRWDATSYQIRTLNNDEPLSSQRKFSTFFVNQMDVSPWLESSIDVINLPVVSNAVIWKSVENNQWARCEEINLHRMRTKWGVLPMTQNVESVGSHATYK